MQNADKKIRFLIVGILLIVYFITFFSLLAGIVPDEDPLTSIGIYLLGGFFVPLIFAVLGLCYILYFFSQYAGITKINKSMIPVIIALFFSLHLIIYFILYHVGQTTYAEPLNTILIGLLGITSLLTFFGYHTVAIIAGIVALVDFVSGIKEIRMIRSSQQYTEGQANFYQSRIKKWFWHLLLSFVAFFLVAGVIGSLLGGDKSSLSYQLLLIIAGMLMAWSAVVLIALMVNSVNYLRSKLKR